VIIDNWSQSAAPVDYRAVYSIFNAARQQCSTGIVVYAMKYSYNHHHRQWIYRHVSQCDVNICLVGGAAQWLWSRSLAGELSLIYAWSMVDTCDHFVGKVSAMVNQADSAFHPYAAGKWVVIHVITWIRGWRPFNGRPELRMAVSCRSGPVHGRGPNLKPIGCTPALSVALDMVSGRCAIQINLLTYLLRSCASCLYFQYFILFWN